VTFSTAPTTILDARQHATEASKIWLKEKSKIHPKVPECNEQRKNRSQNFFLWMLD